jgi:hypothetical protein
MDELHPHVAHLAMQVAPLHPKLTEAMEATYPSHTPEQRQEKLLLYLLFRAKKCDDGLRV